MDQLLTYIEWVLGVAAVLLIVAYPFIRWDRAYRKTHPEKDVRQA